MKIQRENKFSKLPLLLVCGSLVLLVICLAPKLWKQQTASNSETVPAVVSEVAPDSAEVVAPVQPEPPNPIVVVAETEARHRPYQASLKEKWGLEIKSVRLAMAGKILDVRYQVIDPNKAAGLHKSSGQTFIQDLNSGKNLSTRSPAQPLVSQEMLAGKTYYMMFPNRGGVLKSGSPINLVLGDARVENLRVE